MLLLAVLGFNLGVEIGQILFVIGVGLLLRVSFLARRALLYDAIAATVLAMGAYWFTSRGFGV